MQKTKIYPQIMLLIIMAAVMLSACSPMTTQSAPERFVLSFEDGTIAVVDEEKLETITSFDTNISYITGGPDKRHIFMTNRKDGYVQVLDTGVYTNKDGKKMKAAPVLYDYKMLGKEPAHVVSHHGTTAIFYDGSGAIELYTADGLVRTDDVKPEPVQVGSVPAHHGVALPIAGGGFITSTIPSAADKVRGNGIQKVTASGQVVEIEAEIPKLHGEAVSKSEDKEVFTFGGEGKVFIYDEKENKGQDISLPDAEARVGSFAGSNQSKYLIGNYSSKTTPALGTNITVINVEDKTVEKIDLNTTYLYFFAHDGAKTAYVLGTNGTLFVIDLEKNVIKSEITVMEPWESGEGKINPSISITEENILITDPKSKTIKVVNQKNNKVSESTPFDKTPKLITAV